MIAVENDKVSVSDRCERGQVVVVHCENWEREFLCGRCAERKPTDKGRKVSFSYQTDNTGHRKGKNWSKGGRR